MKIIANHSIKIASLAIAAVSVFAGAANAAVDFRSARPRLHPGAEVSPAEHAAWVAEIMRPREGERGIPQPSEPCDSPVSVANRMVDGAVAAAVNNLTGGPRQRVLPGTRGDALGVAHLRECMRRRADDNRVVELRSPDPSEVPHEEGGLLYMSRYATVWGEGDGSLREAGGGDAGGVGMAAGGGAIAAASGQFLTHHGAQRRHARLDPTLGPVGLRFSVTF